jgi:hypothetical protein
MPHTAIVISARTPDGSSLFVIRGSFLIHECVYINNVIPRTRHKCSHGQCKNIDIMRKKSNNVISLKRSLLIESNKIFTVDTEYTNKMKKTVKYVIRI